MLKIHRKKLSFLLTIVLAGLVALSGSVFANQATPISAKTSPTDKLVEWGLIDEGESFNPEQKLTYAKAVPMLVKSFQLSLAHVTFIKAPQATDFFTQVDNDASYAEDFIIANINGIDLPRDVNPDAVMTKEEYTHYLFQAVLATGDYAFIMLFIMIADEDQVNSDYMNSIQKALISNIAELDENDMFHPKKEITQGTATDMLFKALDFVKEHKGNAGPPLPGDLPGDLPVSDEDINDDPDIDFNEEAIDENVKKVTVTWGEQPNPGYRLTIEKIEFIDGQAKVYVKRHYPQDDQMYAQVITEPSAVTYVASDYEVVLAAANQGGGQSSPGYNPGAEVDQPELWPTEPREMPKSRTIGPGTLIKSK